MSKFNQRFLSKLTATKLGVGLMGVAIVGVAGSYLTVANATTNKITPTTIQQTVKDVPIQVVKLNGTFTQGLEQSEFSDNKTNYHVYDPNGLLAKKAQSLGQKGVSQSFAVCIEGRVSEKATYGHLGKNPYELWVDKVCG